MMQSSGGFSKPIPLERPEGLNLYAYGANDPVNRRDPWGGAISGRLRLTGCLDM